MRIPDRLYHLLDSLLNDPARYALSHSFSENWALVFVVGIFAAGLVGAYVLARFLVACCKNVPAFCRWLLRRIGASEQSAPQTFLELIIPADTGKYAYATKQLHILLRGVARYFGFWDQLAARKKPYSLELVGTNDGGIRYVLDNELRQDRFELATLLFEWCGVAVVTPYGRKGLLSFDEVEDLIREHKAAGRHIAYIEKDTSVNYIGSVAHIAPEGRYLGLFRNRAPDSNHIEIL